MDDFPPPPSDEHAQPGEFGPARVVGAAGSGSRSRSPCSHSSQRCSSLSDRPVRFRGGSLAAAPSRPPSPTPLRHPRSPGRRAMPSGSSCAGRASNHRRRRRLRIRRDGDWTDRGRGSGRDTLRGAMPRAWAPTTRSGPTSIATVATSNRSRSRSPRPSRRSRRHGWPASSTSDVTSVYGITGYGDPTFGWRMTPDCDSRACGTRLRDRGNDITMELERKGGTYTASFTEGSASRAAARRSRPLAPLFFT